MNDNNVPPILAAIFSIVAAITGAASPILVKWWIGRGGEKRAALAEAAVRQRDMSALNVETAFRFMEAYQEDIARLRAELDAVRAENADLRAKNRDLHDKVDELEERMERLVQEMKGKADAE